MWNVNTVDTMNVTNIFGQERALCFILSRFYKKEDPDVSRTKRFFVFVFGRELTPHLQRGICQVGKRFVHVESTWFDDG